MHTFITVTAGVVTYLVISATIALVAAAVIAKADEEEREL